MIDFSRQWAVRCQEMQDSTDPDHRHGVWRLQEGLLRLQEDRGCRGTRRS